MSDLLKRFVGALKDDEVRELYEHVLERLRNPPVPPKDVWLTAVPAGLESRVSVAKAMRNDLAIDSLLAAKRILDAVVDGQRQQVGHLAPATLDKLVELGAVLERA